MSKHPNRRDLEFESLDDAVAEAKNLLENGYVQNGNWNLAQVCRHLIEWLRYPMDGYPRPPLPLRVVFWMMKVTMAKKMAKKILAEGFSPGMMTAPETVFESDPSEDAAAVKDLEETIQRLQSFDGQYKPSPLFGLADRETLLRTQTLHCAHHLGYLASNS